MYIFILHYVGNTTDIYQADREGSDGDVDDTITSIGTTVRETKRNRAFNDNALAQCLGE